MPPESKGYEGMAIDNEAYSPGLVVLLGSGETSPSIRKVYDWLFKRIDAAIDVAILETPAGFEPNSYDVAKQIGDYVEKHLQNHRPKVSIIPARKKGTGFSPDDPSILAPLYGANVIMMGPGSPTYAARQLAQSEAWNALQSMHRMGSTIVFASATSIASSVHVLPVYEIYKVGEDLHWQHGLDFFSAYGLSLIFIPHWNNNDGGAALDTSCCYIGRDRYEQLFGMLSGDHVAGHTKSHQDHTVVGIDENTALIIDPAAARCYVMGPGGVTVISDSRETHFAHGSAFDAAELGDFRLPEPAAGIDTVTWARTVDGVAAARIARQNVPTPSDEVMQLVAARVEARAQKDWAASDDLRDRIAALGWAVLDTADGPVVEYQGN